MHTSLAILLSLLAAAQAMAGVEYNRDVRPILSDRCFKCHGLDANARKSQLRLDVREEAIRAAKSGTVPIVPGQPEESDLIRRVISTDPDEIMPPGKDHEPLTTGEIAVLKAWIADGAKYQPHWAFVPTKRGDAASIDDLVEARLKERGLKFAPEADAATLVRRVAFDLTGLPPPPELVASLVKNQASFESVVDQLLASPHFGEHLAVAWLDAARYADTNGYFGDKPRQMWLWRDWVIHAFNANMPFDQFTIEQLAGDLLPGATTSQRIATGFNRNHMMNNESGIIDEEYRTEYVVDRVDTTMTTWLGLTAACAQCHDHKFDPISQREFYQLFAFFNTVPETGLVRADNPPPFISVPSPKQEEELKQASVEIAAATQAFAPMKKALEARISAWEPTAVRTLPAPPSECVWHEPFDAKLQPDAVSRGTALVFEPGVRGDSAKFDATQHVEAAVPGFDRDLPWTIGLWVNASGSLSCPLSMIEPEGHRRGIELIWQKGRVQVNLVNRWGVSAIEVATVKAMSTNNWHQIVVTYDGSRTAKGLRVFVDGTLATLDVRRDTLDGTLASGEPLRIGRRDSGLGFYGRVDEVRLVQRQLDAQSVQDWFWGERIRGIAEIAPGKRRAADAEELLDYYIDRFATPAEQQARARVKQAVEIEKQRRAAIPTALVMQEMDKPRATHILERGQYDKPLGEVSAGVPAAISGWSEEMPRNRLGFARWLTSPDHPLTARVAVNRLWQQCFGEGIVRTANDFGSQGEIPTHPELLDWLAVTFREDGWDVKAMLKRIVMSKTYRQQSSRPREGDPGNQQLARGPSGRLSAEMLRDQALAVSGLLVRKLGGPSVKPYQPPGLWEAVSYDGEESYIADTDDGLWRRSIYTYVKRQAPPPSLLTFDGPTREKCTVRRAVTNTPLQALQLLNDDVFVEAARVLAERVLQVQATDSARLQQLWQRVLVRSASAAEIEALHGLLQRQRDRFAKTPQAAEQLLAVGVAKRDRQLDVREHAAWTVVAQTVLNLDETLNKR